MATNWNHYVTLPRKPLQQHQQPTDLNQRRQSVKSIAAINNEDWKKLQTSITYLFHKKKLYGLELDTLNEKVRNVLESDIGGFICEYYKDSILKKGMIVLREPVKETKGSVLVEKLADVWKQFYSTILPTLLAIFYPIQEQGQSIRGVTLVGFRDMVLLKTRIDEALKPKQNVPPEIKQMLLILAGVHDSNPPNENYLKLESLVARVVTPYVGYNGLYKEDRLAVRRQSSIQAADVSKISQLAKRIARSRTFNEEGRNSFRRRSNSRSNSDTSDLTNSLVDVDMLHYLRAGSNEDYSMSYQ